MERRYRGSALANWSLALVFALVDALRRGLYDGMYEVCVCRSIVKIQFIICVIEFRRTGNWMAVRLRNMGLGDFGDFSGIISEW